MAFKGFAEAQATAALQDLIARGAKPALAELEALRDALDVRCESLTVTLAGAASLDPAPLRELAERLAHAAAEEAKEAAQAARTLALDEAERRLELERAEAQKQLELVRTVAAGERDADRLQRAALTEALEKTKEQAEALRADKDAHAEAARAAKEQAEAIRADRDAHAEAARAAKAQSEAIRADREVHVEAARAAKVQAEAIRADRDAHVEAARAAKEQAEAVRAERDAHIEAARTAKEQAEAIRAERDAHIEAVRAVKDHAETIRADRDAQIEVVRAAKEHAEAIRADRDAQLEAVRAVRVQAEALRADRDVQLESVRVAREQLEAIRADRDARLEAARAQQTQLLEETHAQLEATHREAERCAAVRVSEIQALRAELEEARAGMLRARAETSHIEKIVVQPVIARAEVETQKPAPTEPAALPNTPHASPDTAQTSVEIADPFQARCRAVDDAANLSQVLDALIDGVGAVFPRAALFVVKAKSKRLQGWRSVGFTGVAAITREFEFSLSTDSALTRAVSAGRVIFTGDAPQGQQAAVSGEPWTVTFPVTAGDRVVAVVHADGGGRNGDEAPAFDRESALEVSQRLVRSAGERLVVLTTSARTAFGNVISETPATQDVVDTVAEPARQADPPVEDAERYASQLVSEINRYKQPVVPEGPPDRNLHERLAGEIEGARDLRAGLAPSVAAGALGVFEEALGKMLGNGDVEARGQSEQAAAAGQPVFKVQT